MAAEHYLVNFDPVALAVGPLSIHWYGIAYALAFLSFWLVQKALISSRPWYQWKDQDLSDLLFYGMLGVIVGGRVGYVLFYSFGTFLENPLYLFKLWDGGMSFHGGLLGVIVAMGWFGRKTGRTFWQVADFVAPVVPLGLALGRLGNFIGGELWGRASDVPWAMIFPASLPLGVTRGLGLEESLAGGHAGFVCASPQPAIPGWPGRTWIVPVAGLVLGKTPRHGFCFRFVSRRLWRLQNDRGIFPRAR